MPIDLTNVYKKYKGQWVAFKDDQKTVIAAGKTAREAHTKALKKGFTSPILAHMPSELLSYIGTTSV